MKRILFVLLLLPFFASAQKPGYTKRFTKEEVLGFVVDNWFAVPTGGAPVTPTDGQWAGHLWYDSTAGKLKVWDGAWTDVAGTPVTPGIDDVLAFGQALTTNRTIDGGGANGLNINNVFFVNQQTIDIGTQGFINFGPSEISSFIRNTSTNGLAEVIVDNLYNASLTSFSGSGNTDSITVSPNHIRLVADSVHIPSLAGNGVGVISIDNDGLISWSAGGGGTPTLQQVTGQDSITNHHIVMIDDDNQQSIILNPRLGGAISVGNISGNTNVSLDGSGFVSITNSGAFTGRISATSLAANDFYELSNTGNSTDTLATLYDIRQGGGGGSSLLPTTGTGTATGDVTGELDGNRLFITQAGNTFITIDPTAGSESVQVGAYNNTGSGNQGAASGFSTNTFAESKLEAYFNGGAKVANILVHADATTPTITYTADTHTFSGNVAIGTATGNLFEVNNGGSILLGVDPSSFTTSVRGADGTAQASLVTVGDLVGTDVRFELNTDDGTNPAVSIKGLALAKTITLTAANGYLFPSLAAGASTDSVVTVDAATGKIAWRNAASFGGGSGVTTVGSFGSTPTANGANISGTTITFQPANATNPGMITTGSQAFAGNKTFNANPTFGTSSHAAQINVDFAGSGDIPASSMYSTVSGGGAYLFPDVGTGAAGLTAGIAYWNGGGRIAVEVANVASGFGTLTLMKGGGNVVSQGSLTLPYVAKTGTYSIGTSDYLINCTANTFTVTLPTAVGIAGKIYYVTNSGAGVITIATTSSQTFTNVVTTPTTLTLSAVGTVSVMSDGANWIRLTSI